MSNIRDIRQVDIRQKDVKYNGFSDEELYKFIAGIEAEGMLRPPKGFHDEILGRIRRKRKYKKNLQLFSYTLKVITATAASIGIVLIVPGNIGTQEGPVSEYVSQWQENPVSGLTQQGGDDISNVRKKSHSEKQLEDERKAQEKKEQQIQDEIQKRSQEMETRREKEMNQYIQETEKLRDGNFIHQINRKMDGYVSIINEKLNKFVRMEVNVDEKEEE